VILYDNLTSIQDSSNFQQYEKVNYESQINNDYDDQIFFLLFLTFLRCYRRDFVNFHHDLSSVMIYFD